MISLENYTGAKNASGMIPFLINNIPHHEYYYELFAGSARLGLIIREGKSKNFADVDLNVLELLKQMFPGWPSAPGTGNKTFINQSFYQYTDGWKFPDKSFVYLDPPYPLQARSSDRKLYNYDMLTDQEHIDFLKTCLKIDQPVMISTRANRLYAKYLSKWRVKPLNTVDRGGRATELIYMNYPEPQILHQYDYLGVDRTERQEIKRKRDNFREKINRLPAYEMHALVIEMLQEKPDIVQHFFTTQDRAAGIK